MDHESRIVFLKGQIVIFECRLQALVFASKQRKVEEKEFHDLHNEMEEVIGQHVIDYLRE